MISSSESSVKDQINKPNLLDWVTIKIAIISGIKINKAEIKKPDKYPKINCWRDIDFDKINSISLFSKARFMLKQTNKIIPIARIARDDPATKAATVCCCSTSIVEPRKIEIEKLIIRVMKSPR